ncbi:MAG: peptidoglycan-binding domain-containing protein [Desulfosalsimonadaceae bacterium]|nr:peptidoglycan-binding domain-containing protein [Desulfosalsimonadaceae bacterium]
MVTGKELLELAETRIGEKYVNVLVPKDNPDWHGPWDCAEFASWVVYQKLKKLYGCTDNTGNPAVTEAYSGAWVRDASNGALIPADELTALTAPGLILIRKPPMPGRMGHVAISDGVGGTVEAAGTGLGVRRGKIGGRQWDFFSQIPGVRYTGSGQTPKIQPKPYLLRLEEPNMHGERVKAVQRALRDVGVSPGKIDGYYGPHTVAAVYAFQKCNRLVADGVVGPATAKKLKIPWPEHA